MSGDLLTPAIDPDASPDQRLFGVAVATVVDNIDSTGQARVQLKFTWMPERSPWARVATLLAGPDSGTYFLPQAGDEVLVAFHHGDPTEPFVVGSLWNGQDKPPATSTDDPRNTFRIRTPLGHDLEFDDPSQSVTLTTTAEHVLRFTETEIRISTARDTAQITLGADGEITITAKGALKMKAASIELEATKIKIDGDDVTITATGHCGITAKKVDIN